MSPHITEQHLIIVLIVQCTLFDRVRFVQTRKLHLLWIYCGFFADLLYRASEVLNLSRSKAGNTVELKTCV